MQIYSKNELTVEEMITEFKIEVYYYHRYLNALLNTQNSPRIIITVFNNLFPSQELGVHLDFWSDYFNNNMFPPNPRRAFPKAHLIAYFTRRNMGINKQAKLLKMSNTSVMEVQKSPMKDRYTVRQEELELLKLIPKWEQLKLNMKAEGYSLLELPKR